METITELREEKGMNLIYQVSESQLKSVIAETVKRAIAPLESVQNIEPRFVSVEKTMELTDVSRTTLWQWEKKGILLPVKIGRTVKYRYNDIVDFINKGDRK